MEKSQSTKNLFGFNELHKAVISSDEDTIRRLISGGFDNTLKDSVDFTAEELAIILRKDWLLPYLQSRSDTLRNSHRQEISSDYFENQNDLTKIQHRKNEISVNTRSYDKIKPNTFKRNSLEEGAKHGISSSLNDIQRHTSVITHVDGITPDLRFSKNLSRAFTKRKCSSDSDFSNNSVDIYDVTDSGFSTLKSGLDEDVDHWDIYDKRTVTSSPEYNYLKSLTKGNCDKDYHSNEDKDCIIASSLSKNHDQSLVGKNEAVDENYFDLNLHGSFINDLQDINNRKSCQRLYRSHSLPVIRPITSSQSMSEQNEDWEIWDFGQTLDKNNQPIDDDDFNQTSDEKELSWAENSTKSSFTSSYRMDANDDTNEKNIYVFSAKARSLSESCDERVKSLHLAENNNSKELLDVSSEEPRGFTRSLSTTHNEKKKSKSFLSLPFLKKSSSGNSLNISSPEKQKHRSFTELSFSNSNKKSSTSPKLNKKSSSFTSLFRRKKSADESPVSQSQQSNHKITEKSNNEEKVLTITVPNITVTPTKSTSNTPTKSSTNLTSTPTKISQNNAISPTKTSPIIPPNKPTANTKTTANNDRNTNRESGYASNDDTSPTAKKYSITFTPEHTSEKNKTPESVSKNGVKSPTNQTAVLPLLIGVSLGGEGASSNIIKNTLKPHSVSETGYFTLSQKTDTYSRDNNSASAEMESEDKITNDVTSSNNFIKDTSYDNDKVKEKDSKINEHEINMAEFEVVLDTNYDYPQFSTPIKTSTNQEVHVETNTDQDEPIVETRVAVDEVDNPDSKVEHEEIKENSSDIGMRLGRSNGQLPKYDELYISSNETTSTSDKEANTVNNTQNRQRFYSASIDDGDCGDSITSFEQHEREYVMLSQNGLLSPVKSPVDGSPIPRTEELSADDEYAIMYQDYENDYEEYENEGEDDATQRNGLEERRMTMELLNYMPPILERSTEVTTDDISTTDENRPNSQASEEVCPLRLSTENLRLHDEELQKKGSEDNLLQGFVNVVLVNESETMDENEQKSRGLISQASSRRIQRQLNFEDPESCNSLLVNRSETSGDDGGERPPMEELSPSEETSPIKDTSDVNNEENNALDCNSTNGYDHSLNKSFEVPLELSTHSLQHHSPIKVPSVDDTKKPIVDSKADGNHGNMENDATDTVVSNNTKEDDLEERKRYQKKCLWYDYSADNVDGNVTSRTSSNASQEVDDVTTLIFKSEKIFPRKTEDKPEKKIQSRASLQRDPSLAWDGLVLEYDDEFETAEHRDLDDIPEVSDDSRISDGKSYLTEFETTDKIIENGVEEEEDVSNVSISDLVNAKQDPKLLRFTPTIDYGFLGDEEISRDLKQETGSDLNSKNENTFEVEKQVEKKEYSDLSELDDFCRFASTKNSEKVCIESSLIVEEINEKVDPFKIENNTSCDNNTIINVHTTSADKLSVHDSTNVRKQKYVTKSKKVKEDRVRPVKISRNVNFNGIFSDFDGKLKKKSQVSIRSVPAKTFSKPQVESEYNHKNDDVDTSVASLVYGNKRGVKLRPQNTEDYTVISFDDGVTHSTKEDEIKTEKGGEMKEDLSPTQILLERNTTDSNIPRNLENNENLSKDEVFSSSTDPKNPNEAAEKDNNSELASLENSFPVDRNTRITLNIDESLATQEDSCKESDAYSLQNELEENINRVSTGSSNQNSGEYAGKPNNTSERSPQISKNNFEHPTDDDQDSGVSEDCGDEFENSSNWFHQVKPRIYEAYFVACFIVETSQKLVNQTDSCKKELQKIQSIYKMSLEKKACNFSDVIYYLLHFLGYHVEPRFHATIPNFSFSTLLEFLQIFIEQSAISLLHLNIFLQHITCPNTHMIEHHTRRLSLINTCFEKSMQSIRENEDIDDYLIQCFCRINDCYAYFDNEALPRKVCDYLIPYITKENDARFSLSILERLGFMNVNKSGDISHQIPGSLLVLREVFLNSNMTKTSRSLLKTYMEKQIPEFEFCQKERNKLVSIFR